jgi:hypothetical protein
MPHLQWSGNTALREQNGRSRLSKCTRMFGSERWIVQVVYELAPVIATIISAHCPGTRAREDFVRACVHGDWSEATCMIEGMLAEPWHLRGHQETRLREFLQLLQLNHGLVASPYSH